MYATQQDLIDRYGEAELLEIADRDGDQAVDADVVTEALADASDTIDSYLAKRYALPLASTPKVMQRTCCEISRYYLYKDGPPETVEKNYKWAISYLADLSTGKATLPGLATVSASNGDAAQVTAPDPVFTDQTLKGY